MSRSLDLNTLDQVTNKDPLAGLDPTVTSFVHPAMTCGYLFETLRTFHNVPGQGTSASAAATATSGLYFASAMDVSSDGSEKSSSQGSKRIGRRVTSQRSQGMARASQASKTSRRCCKARQTNPPRPRGGVDDDSDNEEAIERDLKDADSFSMNDLITRQVPVCWR